MLEALTDDFVDLRPDYLLAKLTSQKVAKHIMKRMCLAVRNSYFIWRFVQLIAPYRSLRHPARHKRLAC